jgi:hypothetical protein
MKRFLKIQIVLLLAIFPSCNQKNLPESRKVDTYQNIKEELKGTELEKTTPKANIEELEMEVNNGGFSQYFLNSSGQNCFATLISLKKNGKPKTAKLLESAIDLINPNQLSEKELIEKIRKREVEELDDEKVNARLEKLDEMFYKYPDGSLAKE